MAQSDSDIASMNSGTDKDDAVAGDRGEQVEQQQRCGNDAKQP